MPHTTENSFTTKGLELNNKKMCTNNANQPRHRNNVLRDYLPEFRRRICASRFRGWETPKLRLWPVSLMKWTAPGLVYTVAFEIPFNFFSETRLKRRRLVCVRVCQNNVKPRCRSIVISPVRDLSMHLTAQALEPVEYVPIERFHNPTRYLGRFASLRTQSLWSLRE